MSLGLLAKTKPAGVLARRIAADPSRQAPVLLGLAVSVLCAVLSVLRYRRFADTSWDLGIFTEAIRNYAHFQAPVADIKGLGFNLLGDHFSPIIVTAVPAYWVYPSAVSLLVVQALLIGISAVPVCRAAIRILGTRRGIAIGVAYGISWGIQQAANNTFHEVIFAVPLIALVMERLLAERWKAAALWSLPLVLVKEDLGMTVVAVGVYLLLRRQFRLGLALAAYGALSIALTLYVLVPAMNPHGRYDYWTKLGDGGISAEFSSLFTGADVKLGTLFAVFSITGMLALRSPLCVIAVPTLFWRFTSTDSNYWGTIWHYSAILMPVVFMALLDAVEASGKSRRDWVRSYARNIAPAVLGISLTYTLAGNLPLKDLLDGSSYEVGPRGESARQALSEIPDEVSIETNTALMSHLSSRCDVFWVGNTGPLVPDYVALDLWNGWSKPVTDPLGYVGGLHPGARYALVSNVNGYAVMKRQS
ncbi:DUF2079 domain-containing protein [Streptomyces sp. NBC_00820]|uniref:DUF2079 domain-containing protein n=1 Tax=Streptomyces sp. NBC_00820 TaxID=2975842 RepID=UPI002ED1735E|nr:DUF2079 domain-containing protein [Streptomyces sp. NBC_00820]